MSLAPGRDLDNIIGSFITARQADGRAPRTITDYRRCLDDFSTWCEAHQINIDGLDRDAIRAYVAELRARPTWSEATANIHIRNLRAFLRWMHVEGHTPTNLAQAVRHPRPTFRVETPITPDEIGLLINTCDDESYHSVRDAALILFMYDTGLRPGEVISVTVGDWHRGEADAYLIVWASKTRQARFVCVGRTVTSALQMYLDLRQNPPADAPLFAAENGAALGPMAIGHMLRRRAERAGLHPSRCHPYIFRKAFATSFLDYGGDPERLRVLGGWANMDMLKVYVNSCLGRLRDAHRRAGPVDRMGS